MKMRLTPPVAAPGAWLIAGRSAAGAVLLAVTVSACSGGGSSVPSVSAPTSPTNGQSSSHQGTRTPSPAGQASRSGRSSPSTSAPGRGGASASASSHASASSPASSSPASSHASSSATAKPTHTATPAPSHSSAPAFPTAAPETGGGGTAGLQDGLLFGVGGLAVFAGFGALAYRRRLARTFGINEPNRRDQADREPADR
jgi:hypothetical protein